MPHTLTVLFSRQHSFDTTHNSIPMEGYTLRWPDGRLVEVGLHAFCAKGLRFLGLGKYMGSSSEVLIQLTAFPVACRDSDMHRVPGSRVRRMYIERQGECGRLHFMDGTPTAIEFQRGRDEPAVVAWAQLDQLDDGEQQWLDIAAMPMPDSRLQNRMGQDAARSMMSDHETIPS